MARRCTTVPGYGTCCRAAQQGLLNRTMVITVHHPNGGTSQMCAECSTRQSRSRDPRKAGKTVFDFRFHKNAECGIGPGGCPFLNTGAVGGGGGGQRLALPAPGGTQFGGF
jgi:hypothetical protein